MSLQHPVDDKGQKCLTCVTLLNMLHDSNNSVFDCTLAGLDVRFLFAGLACGSVWLTGAWAPSPLQA